MRLASHPAWILPRRVSIQAERGSPDKRELANCRDLGAYVLLGDPGAGKTCAMEAECRATPGARWVQVRHVLAGIEDAASSTDTVFLDGLDELRSGAAKTEAAFDAIAKWLKDSGAPRVRLSCREADWLGETDRSLLARALGDRPVEVLHLEPFTERDVRRVLAIRKDEVGDPRRFWEQAEQHGLIELLVNPLMLDLLIGAVARSGGAWPGHTRTEVFEFACQQLVQEHSEAHQRHLPVEPGLLPQLLDTAGQLCALQLLSGQAGWRVDGRPGSDGYPSLTALPVELRLPHAAQVLRTKLFTVEDHRAEPRHRRIAEFLAARHVKSQGLPLRRVLALLLGMDGRPVEALRGFLAWLAVQFQSTERLECIRVDPLGFVLNGDAARLSLTERVQVLEALAQRAAENVWFRDSQWVSHPFGALATADMEPEFKRLLSDPDRSREHLAFMDCVFDALCHGALMPSLLPSLLPWVEAEGPLQSDAFRVWERHVPVDERAPQLRQWWSALNAGQLEDSDDELRARLLRALYPSHLSAKELVTGLTPRKRRNLIGRYSMLWSHELVDLTPTDGLLDLADAWLLAHPKGLPAELDRDAVDLIEKLLPRLLDAHGDAATDARLYAWLGMGLDQRGSSRLDSDAMGAIGSWIAARPKRMVALLEHGYAQLSPDAQGHYDLWRVNDRLHRATLPDSWMYDLMGIASRSDNARVVEHLVTWVGTWRIDPQPQFKLPSLEAVVEWVEQLVTPFPEANVWLQTVWRCSLENDWRAEDAQRQRRYQAEQSARREERRQKLAPRLQALLQGEQEPQLLDRVAMAHQKRFTDIEGETPVQRVADCLGASEEIAAQAIEMLVRVNERDDLPSADEVLDLDRKGQFHWIRYAALLAAQLQNEQDDKAWRFWTQEQAQRLTAFWLTYGAGETPGWFKTLARERPDQLAPVFSRFALNRMRKCAKQGITGLWNLSHDEDFAGLVPLVLPGLLRAVPLRATEPMRRVLNHELLPALHLLPAQSAEALVRVAVARSGLDPVQRLCWLVALLPFDVQAIQELECALRSNEQRLVLAAEALLEQGVMARIAERLAVPTAKRLIELLAPISRPAREEPRGWMVQGRHRDELLRHLIRMLAAVPTPEARAALDALTHQAELRHWHAELTRQRHAQRAALREAGFQLPSLNAVALALLNQRPANPADLQALMVEQLRELEQRLRHASDFQLPQFWRDDKLEPKVEEDCRDVLVSQLNHRLHQLQVALEPERRHANEKRVDVSASVWAEGGQRWVLPIEIKRDSHRELWTAWRHQLQRLYTQDPQAQGYGIYLVLWFGTGNKVRKGQRLADARALESVLCAELNDEQRARLAIVVLDLSWPAKV